MGKKPKKSRKPLLEGCRHKWPAAPPSGSPFWTPSALALRRRAQGRVAGGGGRISPKFCRIPRISSKIAKFRRILRNLGSGLPQGWNELAARRGDAGADRKTALSTAKKATKSLGPHCTVGHPKIWSRAWLSGGAQRGFPSARTPLGQAGGRGRLRGLFQGNRAQSPHFARIR